MTYQPNNVQGPFLQGSDFFSLKEEDLRTKLTTMYSRIANSVNAKEIAIYDLSETLNGQQFYNPKNIQELRPAFRQVYTFGAIAAGATKTIPHGLKGVTMFTRIYGTAQNATWSYPIPYASFLNLGFQIDIKVDATNIIIINGAAGVTIDLVSGYVTLEYLKN